MKGESKCCAVAFWSRAWIENCGLNFDGMQIVLDVSMGMTSPEAIQSLINSGAQVRHQFSFHGKMYLSNRGAIIGSPNASIRALGPDAPQRGAIELATLLSPESQALGAAQNYFNRLFDEARPVEEALELARQLYRPNRMAQGVNEQFNPQSILDRVRADPGAFGSIGFVFCGNLARDNDEIIEQDIDFANMNEILIEGNIVEYELFDNWQGEIVSNWPEYFVEFYIGKRGGFSVNAYRTILRNPGQGRVRAMRTWEHVFESHELQFIRRNVRRFDREKAIEFWEFIENNGTVFRNAHRIRECLIRAII